MTFLKRWKQIDYLLKRLVLYILDWIFFPTKSLEKVIKRLEIMKSQLNDKEKEN